MSPEQIEQELKHVAMREEVANLRTDLAKTESRWLRWLILLQVPTWLGLLGTMVGVIAMLLKLNH
jgi:hypothetical protein